VRSVLFSLGVTLSSLLSINKHTQKKVKHFSMFCVCLSFVLLLLLLLVVVLVCGCGGWKGRRRDTNSKPINAAPAGIERHVKKNAKKEKEQKI